MDGMKVFEYGSMSSSFQLTAENKLTAYAAMILHYDRQAHLIAIYSPEECKNDSWLNITGRISVRLDEIYGGEGSFDKYIEDHIEEIVAAHKSITRLT
jgi:hypothetical protein